MFPLSRFPLSAFSPKLARVKQDSASHSGSAKLDAPNFGIPPGGFTGTPEEIERQWLEKVYRGSGDSMKQLTW